MHVNALELEYRLRCDLQEAGLKVLALDPILFREGRSPRASTIVYLREGHPFRLISKWTAGQWEPQRTEELSDLEKLAFGAIE